ncbi:MAG: DUF2059 domain-containing protein [Planctomycetota bacterium]|jgi:hypothetical protein
MKDKFENQSKSKRNEITIAIIGLIGIIATGVLSNWDKLFPDQKMIQASYSGYRATGNFETELRYYFEVAGVRSTIENMERQIIENLKVNLTAQHPEEAKEIKEILNIVHEETITVDELIKKQLPVYRKHFTIEELQELNKFYSTEIMQNMVMKIPLIAQDAAPLQVELLQKFQQRYIERVKGILEKD